ncbi:hypothetical protein M3596_21490 [Bacillus subtilis]|uniref:hypothetical protein n=1 Tax=Bacillus subtilis TaxID=1423 RepID=UPI00203F2739|nr:hypothetical protein [Bacillus subtilis]MCM3191291.1 hypothetical protein [Bacillus subtilis]
MDKEEFRKQLVELLSEEDDGHKGKLFVFPENVEGGYNVIAGLTLKQVVIFFGPVTLFLAVLGILPPYTSVILWIIKIIIAVIVAVGVMLFAIHRPIPARRNIRMIDWVKMRLAFSQRQKIYFVKPKKKGFEE